MRPRRVSSGPCEARTAAVSSARYRASSNASSWGEQMQRRRGDDQQCVDEPERLGVADAHGAGRKPFSLCQRARSSQKRSCSGSPDRTGPVFRPDLPRPGCTVRGRKARTASPTARRRFGDTRDRVDVVAQLRGSLLRVFVEQREQVPQLRLVQLRLLSLQVAVSAHPYRRCEVFTPVPEDHDHGGHGCPRAAVQELLGQQKRHAIEHPRSQEAF